MDCRSVVASTTLQCPRTISTSIVKPFSQASFTSTFLRHTQPRSRNSKAANVIKAAGGAGGGVADKPTLTPSKDKKKSTRRMRPPEYRVLLHNDSVNRREYVVQVLLKVVDGMTVDMAVNIMQEAHINGLAVVISCAQEDAERYCEGLRSNGLVSSIEPCGGNGANGA